MIALIVLAGLMLGTVGLVRSMDTSNLLAGNLAFKRASLNAADVGTEQAIAWLSARVDTPTVNQNAIDAGYYASSAGQWDMTGMRKGTSWSRVDWEFNQCNREQDDGGVVSASCSAPAPATRLAGSGNNVSYVIHRLCATDGAVDAGGNACQAWRPANGAVSVYYRITVRVAGPRNTRSHTETVVRF